MMRELLLFRILLTMLFGITCFIAQAQNSRITIGLRAGVSVSRWRLTTPDPNKVDLSGLADGVSVTWDRASTLTDANVGSTFSVPVEFKLNSLFYLQAEISFVQKGSKGVSEGAMPRDLNGNMGFTLKRTARHFYNYIEVPVMAKVRLTHYRITFDWLVGPYAGIALNGKTRVKDNYTYTDGTTRLDKWNNKIDFTASEHSSTDWGLVFGGMLGYSLGNSKFFIDSRYQHGIQNTTTRKTSLGWRFPNKFNRGVIVSIGYLIPIGYTKG